MIATIWRVYANDVTLSKKKIPDTEVERENCGKIELNWKKETRNIKRQETFHLPCTKINIIAASSCALMRILIGLFAWRTLMLVVFVDVVFINDGDDVAVATRFEISVIIAVVIADGIRNNIDISGEKIL